MLEMGLSLWNNYAEANKSELHTTEVGFSGAGFRAEASGYRVQTEKNKKYRLFLSLSFSLSPSSLLSVPLSLSLSLSLSCARAHARALSLLLSLSRILPFCPAAKVHDSWCRVQGPEP
jgi:hypothetical protein